MDNLGSHVSLKAPDYFLGAAREAISYKSEALMIYTGPPQNTLRKPMSDFRIEEAVALLKENSIPLRNVIVHAPYIINLGNAINSDTFELGVEFLKKELQRTAALGASYLVLHPGSYVKATMEEGMDKIIEGLNEALKQDTTAVTICLETMAGKGSEVGFSFHQLGAIRESCDFPNRIAFCLDTCHIHDAGYSLDQFDEILHLWDEVLGLETLKVIHLNDSKNDRGAKKDRHANLGEGKIGFEKLHHVYSHPLLKDVVKILETPWIEDHAPYKEEIEMLRSNFYDSTKLNQYRTTSQK